MMYRDLITSLVMLPLLCVLFFVSGNWDTGNLRHEVTSQLIKLSLVVYCGEMPAETNALEAKPLWHLTFMTVMTARETMVWDGCT